MTAAESADRDRGPGAGCGEPAHADRHYLSWALPRSSGSSRHVNPARAELFGARDARLDARRRSGVARRRRLHPEAAVRISDRRSARPVDGLDASVVRGRSPVPVVRRPPRLISPTPTSARRPKGGVPRQRERRFQSGAAYGARWARRISSPSRSSWRPMKSNDGRRHELAGSRRPGWRSTHSCSATGVFLPGDGTQRNVRHRGPGRRDRCQARRRGPGRRGADRQCHVAQLVRQLVLRPRQRQPGHALRRRRCGRWPHER